MTNWDDKFSERPNVRIRATVTVESQDLVAGKTTLRRTLKAQETAQQPTYSGFKNDNSWSMTVAGSGRSGDWTFDFTASGNQSKTLHNSTLTVEHDEDGDLEIAVAASANSLLLGSASIGTKTLALPRIPQTPAIGGLVVSGATEATLGWSAPANDNGVVVGYRIQYGTDENLVGATVLEVGNVTTRLLTGLTPGSLVYARVAARTEFGVTAYSDVVSVVVTASIGELDGWGSYGALPGGLSTIVDGALRRGSIYPLGAGAPSGLLREVQRSGSGSVSAAAVGIQRTFTGLTVGATYRLAGTVLSLQDVTPSGNVYRWAVVGVGHGDDATITDTDDEVEIPEYEFVATSASHVVRIELNEAAAWSGTGWFESAGFYGITLTEVPDPSPYRLQDVALETSLARHFTVACDTVGAVWWVDSDDVTQFRQVPEDASVKAIFTDKRAPGELEYVDLATSYDTRNVVNDLAATNFGRDAETGNSLDLDYSLSDDDSISDWGVRSGSIEMAMRSGFIDRMNLAPNAKVLIDLTNWERVASGTASRVASGGPTPDLPAFARDTLSSSTNTYGLRLGATTPLTLTPDETYVVSAWVRLSVAASVIVQLWNSATGWDTQVTQAISANVWTRLSQTVTVPAGTTTASVRVFRNTGSNASSGATFDVTGVRVTPATGEPDDADYLDGDMIDLSGDFIYEWLGDPGVSESARRSFVDLNARLSEILETLNVPQVVVSSITWNAQENPALAASLDGQDRIRVRFRGKTRDCRIVGIRHEVTGTRWLVMLELAPS